MSEYIADYEAALKAMERLHGKTACAAKNVQGLGDKLRLQKLAREIMQCREALRLLLYDVRDTDTDVGSLECICPTVTKGGMRIPMVIDAGCNAYEHGGPVA